MSSYQQSIPKKLAHKHSIHEVFLTGFKIKSQNEMVLYAELPRSHGLYCEKVLNIKKPDLTLLIEICRQSCFVVAHKQYDVPLEGNRFQFLFQKLNAKSTIVEDLNLVKPILVIECSVSKSWQRKALTSGLEYDFILSSNDIELAKMTLRMMWVERPKWKEMRLFMRKGRGLEPTRKIDLGDRSVINPEEVGRINPANVVLKSVKEESDNWTATPLVNLEHPIYFDHPIDHIYAMVQIEICRQFAFYIFSKKFNIPASHLEMTSCSAEFQSIAEFDLETKISTTLPSKINNASGFKEINIKINQGSRLVSFFNVQVNRTVELISKEDKLEKSCSLF